MKNNIIMLLVFLFCSNLFAVYVPLEDNTVETIEELGIRGYNLRAYPDIKGYFISFLTDRTGLTSPTTWLIDKINRPVFRFSTVHDSTGVTKTSIFIPYEQPPFSLIVEPVIKFGNENVWPTEKFKGKFAADYERAFVKIDFLKPKRQTPLERQTNLELLFGREKIAIGPSTRYNLLLSGYSPPMDLVFSSYTSKKFKLSFLFSKLDNINNENFIFTGDTIHNDSLNARRFMSLRRLELNPVEKFTLGLSEAVIYGGKNAIPELYYLNPVALSYPYEFIHTESDHNVLWDIDARLNFKLLTVYGEFLMDDFQYGKDEQGEPNHVGLLGGLRGIDLFGVKKTFWQIEYVRVSRWAYNHFHPWQRVEYLGYPLGHPLGPGFDEMFTKLTYHWKSNVDLHTAVSYTRKGAAAIDDIWPISESPRVQGQSFPVNNFLIDPAVNYLNIKTGAGVVKNISKMQAKFDAEIGIIKTKDEINPCFSVNTSLSLL